MPTSEQLEKFYSDDLHREPASSPREVSARPAPAPGAKPAAPALRPTAASRASKMLDDMEPRSVPVDKVAADRAARLRRFYELDAEAGAAPPGAKGEAAPPAAVKQPQLPAAPEGVDPGDWREAVAVATKLGLDAAKASPELLAQFEAAREREAAGWRKAAEADPEVMRLVAPATALVKEFGGAELEALLDTGLGDNPQIIRLLGQVGEELAAARGARR